MSNADNPELYEPRNTCPCRNWNELYGKRVNKNKAVPLKQGFPGGSVVKYLPTNAGDVGSILDPRRSPGEGNGNPFQYSCLGNPMDRGAWQATVREVAKSRTRLSD